METFVKARLRRLPESEGRIANVSARPVWSAKVEYLYTYLGGALAWPARHIKPK